MLRRSALLLRNLRSAYRHGMSPTSKSSFPAILPAECGYPFRSPASVISPIQFNISQSTRQYCGKSVKDMTEEELEKKIAEIIAKAEEEGEEEGENEDDEGEDEEIRYEDFEPELKIFEDPFLDREPPPEPDEETKKDVAELVETLKKLVEKMPIQKPRKNQKGRSQARTPMEQLEEEMQRQNEEYFSGK